jgi:branched-chain amino acid transport system substrate-binding protein
MQRHRRYPLLAVLFSLIFVLAACAPAAAPAGQAEAPAAAPPADTAPPLADPGNVIKIGAMYPLTGDQAKLGEDNKNGLELAIAEINAAGGIKALDGAQLELVWGDTQAKAEVGISEVTRLIQQEGVLAVIGAYNSSVTNPATQEAEKLKTPFVVSMAVSDVITERGFQYTFRLCPKASWYAKDQVSFLKDLKDLAGLDIKKVALLHEDSDFGESTAAGQKQYLAEAGMEMVIEVKYSSNAPDLTTEVSKIKAANPDAVLTVTYLNDSILISQAREALGLTNIPWVDAAGGTIDPEFIKQLGASAEGWFTEMEYSKYAAGAEALNNRFKKAYGYDITGNSVYAYQAGYVIADALERAAKADKEALRAALAATKMAKGETMVMHFNELLFDEQGQNPNATVFVMQVQNGELIPVWPKDAAYKPVNPLQ